MDRGETLFEEDRVDSTPTTINHPILDDFQQTTENAAERASLQAAQQQQLQQLQQFQQFQQTTTNPLTDDTATTTNTTNNNNNNNTNNYYANYGSNNLYHSSANNSMYNINNGNNTYQSLSAASGGGGAHGGNGNGNHTGGNHGGGGGGRLILNDSDTSSTTFLRWTTCDEVKRCSVAVISFIILAALVGSSLVLFWFLWAWFVLYLNLPGVLTPIVWLLGFIAPLCLFRIFSIFPKCIKCLCCNSGILSLFGLNGIINNGQYYGDTILEPQLTSWKGGQLFSERRKHVISILEARKELPIYVCEIISNYCFHYDILVTTKKNKMIGIYPDSALLHTVAEFSKDVAGMLLFC